MIPSNCIVTAAATNDFIERLKSRCKEAESPGKDEHKLETKSLTSSPGSVIVVRRSNFRHVIARPCFGCGNIACPVTRRETLAVSLGNCSQKSEMARPTQKFRQATCRLAISMSILHIFLVDVTVVFHENKF
jgi:hypothetical protein